MSEAPFEFGVGAAQSGLRIDFEMPGEVHGREEQVADFTRQRLYRTLRNLSFDLDDFLPDFLQDCVRIIPVEADFAGFLLQLQGPGESRQCKRYAIERAGLALLASSVLCLRCELQALLV